jgi:hypothetical protein
MTSLGADLRSRPRVGVIGSAHPRHADDEDAEAVGRMLAERGAILVCGGLGGVMAAACRGAGLAGGLCVGILPDSLVDDANPWVDIPIATGMGQARNVLVVLNSQAVIAVRGGPGTLSEIGLALKLGRIVVGLDTWRVSRTGTDLGVRAADSAAQAVELALAAVGQTALR